MSEKIEAIIQKLILNAGAVQSELDRVQLGLNRRLPDEYVAFLRKSNGAEGPIGDYYLQLWPVQELEHLNAAYSVDEFAPGLLLFGSDGGDTAFAFDTRTPDMAIVKVPFVGMGLEETRPCSQTFYGFLEYLSGNE